MENIEKNYDDSKKITLLSIKIWNSLFEVRISSSFLENTKESEEELFKNIYGKFSNISKDTIVICSINDKSFDSYINNILDYDINNVIKESDIYVYIDGNLSKYVI